MQVEVSDPEEEIKVLKTQDFERQFNSQRHTNKDQGFALPDDLKIDDLVEFNKKLMSQVWAIVNPSQMQVNQREGPLKFDFANSTKNYLMVPLKLQSTSN